MGTVGAGSAKVLQDNQAEIQRRLGCEVVVTAASVRDLNADRDCDCSSIDMLTDPFAVIERDDVDIVVELIGGDSLAKELVMQAMSNGKHVVTANKALVAMHGDELFAHAQAHQVAFCFEAAVAGGISIIKALREGLAGNQIELIAGIINGTGNFILTEMRDKGRDFDDVLKEAQTLGYAEADPTFDVEGIDAAHKLTILAALGFGIPMAFDKLIIEGISDLELKDVDFAGELGYRIKHLGIAKATDAGLELRVHPTLIPSKRLIANVDGVMNAVLVKGNAVGNTLHYGAGAGALPTASAVVADICDVVRAMSLDVSQRVPYTGFQASQVVERAIKLPEQIECAFYLRFEVADVPGVMSKLSAEFAQREISIEAIKQTEPEPGQESVSVIFITQITTEASVNEVLSTLGALPEVSAPVVKLRVEHFH